MRSRRWGIAAALLAGVLLGGSQVHAQQAAQAEEGNAIADPADLAFEQGRWQDAIVQYRQILAERPDDRLSLLRIAQAQRELKRYDDALVTLEQARTANAPEAMIDFERARNLALLHRDDDALAALDASDHNGLRALELVERAHELDAYRAGSRFQRVYRNVRSRVYPCEGMEATHAFDFWLGHWEVRMPDGTLAGTNTIVKRDGGCALEEHWEGSGGATGTSHTFYLPSRGEWRQVWTGSGGTFFDITGKPAANGSIHMEGQLEYADTHQVVAFRGTWTPGADGRVRQRLEEFDLVGKAWIVWFDGFYRRID